MSSTVDKLKSEGKHYEAGVLTGTLNLNRYYGCHFGMRSDREAAMSAFYAGFDSVR